MFTQARSEPGSKFTSQSGEALRHPPGSKVTVCGSAGAVQVRSLYTGVYVCLWGGGGADKNLCVCC